MDKVGHGFARGGSRLLKASYYAYNCRFVNVCGSGVSGRVLGVSRFYISGSLGKRVRIFNQKIKKPKSKAGNCPAFFVAALSRHAAAAICRCNIRFIILIEAVAQGVEIERQFVADVLQLLPQ